MPSINPKKFLAGNQPILATFFAISLPLAMQNAINYALNLVDTLMVGGLGESELSAVTLAGQPAFILFCVIFGFSSATSILVAQYWGKKDRASIQKITGFVCLLSFVFSSIIALACFFFPQAVMSLYTDDPTLIELGARFLVPIAPSYVLSALSTILLVVLRCTEETRVPLFINSASLAVNTLFNYLLIFGAFGFPKMGIAGSAVATLIARILEFCFVVFYLFLIDKRIALRFGLMLKQNAALVKDFFKYGAPAVANDVLWGIGVSFHSVIIGHLGTTAVAAYSVNNLLERFTFIIVSGIGSAAAIIVGKELGAGNHENAEQNARFLLKISSVIGVFFAVVALIISPFLIGRFPLSSETAFTAQIMVLFMAFTVLPKSMNYTIGVGFLRSGGDSRYMAFLDIIALYSLALPLGYLAGYIWKLPAYFVYAFLISDETAKLAFYYRRYRKKIWLRNITREDA